MVNRRVVLICGPPGSGKTTYAHTLDLEVYDKDDPPWTGDEAAFRRSIQPIATDPAARAAVIRSGATRSARRKAAAVICATETVILDVDPGTCIQRITQRGRPHIRAQIAGVKAWWDKHEPEDAIAAIGQRSRDW